MQKYDNAAIISTILTLVKSDMAVTACVFIQHSSPPVINQPLLQ